LTQRILGISARFHDAAACVLVDGTIVAAAQEERFSRIKHDSALPQQALRYCLAEAGVKDSIDAVVFYDKPIEKFHRILESFAAVAPAGLRTFTRVMPLWLRDKLWLPPQIDSLLAEAGVKNAGKLYFTQHHEAHAASAFYPSPFDEAAILTVDGVGEWATSVISCGEGSAIAMLKELRYPHSLGLLYSAFAHYGGFRVNRDEYKLMGLAPYGENRYGELIKKELLDLKPDGSFRLNMKYFGFLDDAVMVNENFCSLMGGAARLPSQPVTGRDADIARSIQCVCEEILVLMAKEARRLTGKKYLCLAGGVALNCVANGRLLRENIFDDIWIQPAADDAGGAIGAALALHHREFKLPRRARQRNTDDMQGALLGPAFGDSDIRRCLDANSAVYRQLAPQERASAIAALLAQGKIVGVFDGRMEFGPRALGNRSILADPRVPGLQTTLNRKIKQREDFRPFAAAVLEEKAPDYFAIDVPSPYMLFTAFVTPSLRQTSPVDASATWAQRLAGIRSPFPAVTHVDYSCRLQTVSAERHPRFHAIIQAFESLTGLPLVLNTSFNTDDEPIVCAPDEAWRCFRRAKLDALVLGDFLVLADREAAPENNNSWEQLISRI
jgi:carbamoyltransferase